MADAQDLKSWDINKSCGFKSRHRHHVFAVNLADSSTASASRFHDRLLSAAVSTLTPRVARKELQEKSLVSPSLGRRKLKRTWRILHWRGRRLSLAEETFVSLCRTVTEELAQRVDAREAA